MESAPKPAEHLDLSALALASIKFVVARFRGGAWADIAGTPAVAEPIDHSELIHMGD